MAFCNGHSLAFNLWIKGSAFNCILMYLIAINRRQIARLSTGCCRALRRPRGQRIFSHSHHISISLAEKWLSIHVCENLGDGKQLTDEYHVQPSPSQWTWVGKERMCAGLRAEWLPGLPKAPGTWVTGLL